MKFNIQKRIISNFVNRINFAYIKKIFFFLSLLYFSYYFLINLKEISYKLDFSGYQIYLILSFLLCLLSIFLNALAWENIIIWFGYPKKIKKVKSFFLLTNSLKYVPGGIWHFIERFNYINKFTNFKFALSVTLIEPYFMLTSSLLIASIGIFLNPFYIVFIIPSIFLERNLITHILLKLESLKINTIKLLKISNKETFYESDLQLRISFPLKPLIIEVLFILMKFLAFYSCFYVFNFSNMPEFIFLLVIFCLSWSIGLIVPSPGGFLVFEYFFLLFIGNGFSKDIVLISLVYFRVISTSADLILSAPFLIKMIRRKI